MFIAYVSSIFELFYFIICLISCTRYQKGYQPPHELFYFIICLTPNKRGIIICCLLFTEEQVQAIVDAVVENLDTLTEITAEVLDEVLNVLESDSVTEEQVQEIVDTILATEVTSDQATQLATSAAVLESITGDQATEANTIYIYENTE